MKNFFTNIPFDEANQLGQLTRLMYDLRENRKDLLAAYAATDEHALLDGITSGEISEHPAYEHYLAALILEDTRDQARQILAQGIAEAQKP